MDSSTTILATRLGKVCGVDHGDVKEFLGLRYGLSTAGRRRFLPPVMAPKWDDTFDATQHPNQAMQQIKSQSIWPPVPGEVSEDCLFLNIVTPTTQDKPRPVLFWIHGGGFVSGSANEYDGSVLAAQGDVVVVTVNFRLGALGFLDLSAEGPEYRHSGSNGVLDIILALEWVRDNIQDYGGDPVNVTLFGESSGGTLVLSLLAAPGADALYHKAIAHSATCVFRQPSDRADALAKRLKVDRSKYMAALLSLSGEEIVGLNIPAGVCIDGSVITRSSLNAIAERGKAGVPLMTGTNLREGTLYTNGDDASQAHYPSFNAGLAKEMLLGGDPQRYLIALDQAYSGLSGGKRHELIWTDMFRRICLLVAESATRAGAGGWLYRFDLPANLPQFKKLGATHSAEMAFTFNNFATPERDYKVYHDWRDPTVRRVAKVWSDTIIRFAKTGQPNGGELTNWPKYNDCERYCLVLNEDFQVQSDRDKLHRNVWQTGAVM
jgi:para-nitrobenzyl esterase